MSRTQRNSPHEERREAWSAAKLAVRSYARDPTDSNAGRVASAWRRVRAAGLGTVDRRRDPELVGLERGNRHR
jgi:hypothetical protein